MEELRFSFSIVFGKKKNKEALFSSVLILMALRKSKQERHSTETKEDC